MPKLQKQLYLQHDVYELTDDKMAMLDKKFPYMGHSIFWRLCSYMLQADVCEASYDRLEIISERNLYCPYEDVTDVVDYCIKIGLFHKTEDGSAFYNNRVKIQWEKIKEEHDRNVKNGSDGGKKSAAQRAASPPQAPLEPGSSPPQSNKNKKESNNKKDNNNQTNIDNNVSCTEQTSLLHAGGVTDNNDLLLVDAVQYTDFTLQLNDGSLYHVTKTDLEQWQKNFPAVDVEQQLRQMSAWSDANQKQRKTRQGIKPFIVRWLSKEQDKARVGNSNSKPKSAYRGADITFEGREY